MGDCRSENKILSCIHSTVDPWSRLTALLHQAEWDSCQSLQMPGLIHVSIVIRKYTSFYCCYYFSGGKNNWHLDKVVIKR